MVDGAIKEGAKAGPSLASMRKISGRNGTTKWGVTETGIWYLAPPVPLQGRCAGSPFPCKESTVHVVAANYRTTRLGTCIENDTMTIWYRPATERLLVGRATEMSNGSAPRRRNDGHTHPQCHIV
jgi:hypothetical protein